MTRKKPDPLCCLCGLPYERLGNNAQPLGNGRCCDACDEIVIQARIMPTSVATTVERVESALRRMAKRGPRRAAIAAICAASGPLLLAEKREAMLGLAAGLKKELLK